MRMVSCLLGLLLFTANAFGQTLVWEFVEDFSNFDTTRDLTLSKKAAIFIGSDLEDGTDGFVIQSLNRTNGSVRWTDHVPSDAGISTGLQIASSQGRVFAAGYKGRGTAGSDVVVRAYEAATGTLLWNSVWEAGGNAFPQDVAAGPSAVVVVGWGGDTAGHARSFIVRAYDPIAGTVLWEDRVERSAVYTVAKTVAIARNRVIVAGNTAAGELLVRAYNASSGKLLWEITRPATAASAIKVVGGRVFLAGSSFNRGYVGAFEEKSGSLLWEDDATPTPGYFRDIAVEGNRLVAAGSSASALLVRAYDVPSGGIEWQDHPSVLPGFAFEFVASVALNDRAVYVAGTRVQDFGYSEMMVRGYEVTAGTLLWDDRSHPSASPPGANAVDVALGKKRLFVAGWAFDDGPGTDFVIRAYDIRHDGIVPQY